DDLLLLKSQRGELGLQLFIRVAQYTGAHVGWDGAGPEDLGEAAATRSPVDLQLPEAVLSHGGGISHEQAAGRFGEDVGYAELVAADDRGLAVHIERGAAFVVRPCCPRGEDQESDQQSCCKPKTRCAASKFTPDVNNRVVFVHVPPPLGGRDRPLL